MSITYTPDRPAFLPKIATSGPEFDDEQVELLETTRDRYFACVTRLIQVEGVKQVLRRASADFARGKITLHEATALCSVTNSSTERYALQRTLNHAVKTHIKEVLSEAHEIVIKAAQHRADELQARCSDIESRERENCEDCGISQDDFTPSESLRSLRRNPSLGRVAISAGLRHEKPAP